MDREEMIKSLKACATENPDDCSKCCIHYDIGCHCQLMEAAAEMIDQDGKALTVAMHSMEQILVFTQRISDILNPVSTAEEMFRNLGFLKNTSSCYNENHVLYEKSVMNGIDVESVEFRDGNWVFTSTLQTPMHTSGSLTKAIYKQLEEMGWLDLTM